MMLSNIYKQEREPYRGRAVVYTDESGKAHDALITRVWSGHCCNLLYLGDQTETGGQIEKGSICHKNAMGSCPGNFWQLPEEYKEDQRRAEQARMDRDE